MRSDGVRAERRRRRRKRRRRVEEVLGRNEANDVPVPVAAAAVSRQC